MGALKAAVLALDGGNSKTDVALVAADGTLLASGRAPGAREFPSPAGIAAIDAAVTEAARRAGLPGGRSEVTQVIACMANADLPEEEERLAGLLAAQGWGERTEVVNDTFAVLRAGLTAPPGGRPWGVGVTCGAGINCVGVAPDGRTAGYLALGGITGDWGGGLGLGRAALWHACRAEDGRGPQTMLRSLVSAHFGKPDVRGVSVAIHLGDLSEDDLQQLVPALLDAARCDDPVAARLVGKLADEIAAMAGAVLRRLGMTGLEVPVVLGGGILTGRDPLLTSLVISRLAAGAPLARPAVVTVPPIAGAALLGLDRLPAAPAAELRLRAAYTPA